MIKGVRDGRLLYAARRHLALHMYEDGYLLREIAEVMRVTPENVRALKKKAERQRSAYVKGRKCWNPDDGHYFSDSADAVDVYIETLAMDEVTVE